MICDENFRYVEKGRYYILAEYLKKKDKDVTQVVVPETFNGRPVNIIGNDAFKFAVYIERITLPDSVVKIERKAFGSCRSLREIVWGKGLRFIDSSAFQWCTDLERLELPEGLRRIDSRAFDRCSSLKEVTLPHSLVKLDPLTFRYCSVLEKVVFLSKDTVIGDYAESLSAETPMYNFSCGVVFHEYVFALAMEYNSFKDVDKYTMFEHLLHQNLMDRYLPYMIKNGWIYQDEQLEGFVKAIILKAYYKTITIPELEKAAWFADKKLAREVIDGLIYISGERNQTEFTAWLLDYKQRNLGFDLEDEFDL